MSKSIIEQEGTRIKERISENLKGEKKKAIRVELLAQTSV
jgi:hypothetical protein